MFHLGKIADAVFQRQLKLHLIWQTDIVVLRVSHMVLVMKESLRAAVACHHRKLGQAYGVGFNPVAVKFTVIGDL